MAKNGKGRVTGRELRNQLDKEDARGRVDFTDHVPEPTLEDEYFGGFRKEDANDDPDNGVERICRPSAAATSREGHR